MALVQVAVAIQPPTVYLVIKYLRNEAVPIVFTLYVHGIYDSNVPFGFTMLSYDRF